MDELFNSQLPDGEKPDIQLCIFPHLKEFIAIDSREQPPQILLLSTENIFIEEFYKNVEADFSEVLREENPFPFAHFINLPLRLEEIVRETAMTFILDSLGQEVVKRHGAGRIRPHEGRYVDFVKWLRLLIEDLPEGDRTPERVDYFYWLRGMFDGKGALKDEISLEAWLVLSRKDDKTVRLVGELKGEG